MNFGIALGLTIGIAFIAINNVVLNMRMRRRKW